MAAPTLRPPTVDDAGEIARMLTAHAASSGDDAGTTSAEVADWFGFADLDPEHDMRVAVAGDGTIVGYGDVSDHGGLGTVFNVDVRVHPESPEAAAVLLDAMEDRAREQAQPDAAVRLFLGEHEHSQRSLAEQRGYRIVRSSYRMGIGLEREAERPSWPDGIAARAYDPADEERVYEAQMEAFAGHWGFVRATREMWRSWNLGANSDPSLWRIAWDGGEIAGLCLNRPERGEGLGWVDVLAVREPWRRRGLGRALLLDAFETFRSIGRSRAGLGVDTENTAGAVALYESVGMSVVTRTDTWERTL